MKNNELMHYGVLGMKWGKRKASYNTSSGNKTGRRERKQAINKAYKDINKNRSTASKLGISMYNNATYRKAAQYMVDKGMDQKTAISKAKINSWINTGITVTGSILYLNRDKIASGVKKYANEKAMQRANAGLARIGTMKLTKVAGNVYEYKMR